MTHDILAMLQDQAASFINYGPPGDQGKAIEIVDTFGPYEAEYAAIRKGVGLLVTPHRATIRVTGGDRADFLHRLITNDVRSLASGAGCRAFFLGKNGRIIADMLVLQSDDHARLVLDALDAQATISQFDAYRFSDDVQFTHLTDEVMLSLHGPGGVALIGAVDASAAEAVNTLKHLQHAAVTIAGIPIHVVRNDEAGAMGLHLSMPQAAAGALLAKLADVVGGLVPEVEGGVRRAITGRGIGWLAFNTARIEAGSPLFHVDFGPDSLPHETGILEQTVSFKKGCYIGQEIVARMHNLGHPKKVLVGLRFEDDRLPLAGAPVLEPSEDTADVKPIGGVTSSTLSPLRGNQAIALAMMKWGKHRPDTRVLVPAEGDMVPATVQALSFLPNATA
jgi:folate-binding protein YgfZ